MKKWDGSPWINQEKRTETLPSVAQQSWLGTRADWGRPLPIAAECYCGPSAKKQESLLRFRLRHCVSMRGSLTAELAL